MPSYEERIAALRRMGDRRHRRFRELTEKYRAAIGKADPRVVGADMEFTLAHNWGNAPAKQLLARYRRFMHRQGVREDASYAAWCANQKAQAAS
jgi:hypothetical protein